MRAAYPFSSFLKRRISPIGFFVVLLALSYLLLVKLSSEIRALGHPEEIQLGHWAAFFVSRGATEIAILVFAAFALLCRLGVKKHSNLALWCLAFLLVAYTIFVFCVEFASVIHALSLRL